MDAIIATRYEPLVLPHKLNAFLVVDYFNYFLGFNGEGEVKVEEHLKTFYSFADKHNVEHAYVWIGFFV